MAADEQHDRAEDVLDRATKVLRDTAVPARMPPDLLDRTVVAVRTSEQGLPARLIERLFTMKTLAKLSIAAVVLIAVAGSLMWATGLWGTKLAFADVLQGVREAKAVRFKQTSTVKVPNQPAKTVTGEVLLVEPGLMRQTVHMDGIEMISITDFSQGKQVSLSPAGKQATVIQFANMPAAAKLQNILEQWKSLDGKAATPLGHKKIAGIEANGFRIASRPTEWTVWVDPDTKLPVEMDVTMKVGFLPATTSVYSDFEWNPKVDPGLLSLTPPEGYRVQNMSMNMAPVTEKDLIEALKAAAELAGGGFPDSFDMAGLGKTMKGLDQTQKEMDAKRKAELSQAILAVGRGWMFIGDPKNGTDWHYAGKGATLGQANQPIFWYRPANATTYRVIYADLSVRDVAEANLPNIPSTLLQPPTTKPSATQP